MSKTRKVSLDEYTEEIKNKGFSDYLDEMLCDPEDLEIVEIVDDGFARAWERVGEDLRNAMGKMDEEIGRIPQGSQKEKQSDTLGKSTG